MHRARPLAIAVRGPFSDPCSFTVDNRFLTKAFRKQGHDVLIFAADGRIKDDPSLAICQRTTLDRLQKIQFRPDVFLTHTYPWPSEPGHGRLNIAVLPWEFYTIPQKLEASLRATKRYCNALFVYSSFLKNVFANHGVPRDRIKIAKLGYDPDEFFPAARPAPLPTRKKFKFLNLGGMIPRKGTDILLRAFCEEFSAEDDVCLVIKAFAYKKNLSWAKDQIHAAKKLKSNPPEILMIHRNEASVAGYYTACDIGVFPFRAEGFCLPILEMMACGRPSILTAGMGPSDFCDTENSILLPAGVGYLRGMGECREPDKESLKRKMRFAFENRPAVKRLGGIAQTTVRGMTWDAAARSWLDHFESLLSKPNPRFPMLSVPASCRQMKDFRLPLCFSLAFKALRSKKILVEQKTAFTLSETGAVFGLFEIRRAGCRGVKALVFILDHSPQKIWALNRNVRLTSRFLEILCQYRNGMENASKLITNFPGLADFGDASRSKDRIVRVKIESLAPALLWHHEQRKTNLGKKVLVHISKKDFLSSSLLNISESGTRATILFPDFLDFDPIVDRRRLFELRRIIQSHDFFYFVSDSPQGRLVAVEAMAMKKLLCVVKRIPWSALIKHGENGFIFSPANLGRLHRPDNAPGRAALRELGRKARQTVLKMISRKIEAAFVKALNHGLAEGAHASTHRHHERDA